MAEQARTVKDWLIIKKDPAELVRERYNIAHKATSKQRQDTMAVSQSYHGYVQQSGRRRGRANFHFDRMFQQIEMEAARFITAYFRHNPFTSVLPTNESSVELARSHEEVLQHYQEHAPTFFIEKVRMIKYCDLFGTAWSMPSWKTEVRKVKKLRPIKYGGKVVDHLEELVDEVVYDGLSYRTFSPTEVFPCPHVTSMATLPWVVVEEFCHVDELVQRAQAGVYRIEQVNKIPLNCSGQDNWEVRKRMGIQTGLSTHKDEELIRLQHLFARDRFVTLANDDVVIRETPNVFFHGEIPLIQGVKTINPDSLWGIGSGKHILPNQKIANLFMNSAIDSVISSLFPVWLHRSHVRRNQLLSLPNQKIQVRHPDDVQLLRMPELKHDLLALLAANDANIEDTTGYFGSQKGRAGGARQTATSDAIFQHEGNLRVESDVLTLERVYLTPEARQVSKLIQQFMPDELDVRINGPGGFAFQKRSKDDIRGEFDFKVGGASESINRAVMQQQLVEFFNTAQGAVQYVQMPEGQIVPVPVLNAYEAMKDIFEGWNRHDSDKLMYRPEVFGIPLNNDMLSAYGLPAIPGMDQLEQQPATGALRRQGMGGGQHGGRSVNPTDQIQSANRPKAAPAGVI